jgi:hypothetical protein
MSLDLVLSNSVGDKSAGTIAVADPRRPAIRRAILSTLWAAAAFSVFTGPVKQIKPLYDHAPWCDDPFDMAVSFAMFFVPLIAVCCLARVSLCRRSEPLPSLRVLDLLRGCRVVLAAIALTLLSEWIAVATKANQAQWDRATWLQIGLLVVLTALAGNAGVYLRRASTSPLAPDAGARTTSDWLTDMTLIAKAQSHWLGPLDRPSLRMLSWIEQRPIGAVRRHPLWTAATACFAFGLSAGGNQAVREGYDPLSTITTVTLLSSGMFGLLVGAGAYLGLVRSDTHLVGTKRRAIDAIVFTCVGVLVPFAFRDNLWWIIGSDSTAAGVPQLGAMLGIFAVLIFAAVFATESLLRLHAKPTRRPIRLS